MVLIPYGLFNPSHTEKHWSNFTFRTIMSKIGINIHIQNFYMNMILYFLGINLNKYLLLRNQLKHCMIVKGNFRVPIETIKDKIDIEHVLA